MGVLVLVGGTGVRLDVTVAVDVFEAMMPTFSVGVVSIKSPSKRLTPMNTAMPSTTTAIGTNKTSKPAVRRCCSASSSNSARCA